MSKITMKDMDQILANSDIDETLMKQGVSICGLVIYITKGILKAKEELWKLKTFCHAKI
jgi:hypothetical protein